MKIEVLEKKTIAQNDDSLHNYWGWPTVTRLRDGRLAAVASGFRLTHVCPFGKAVIMYSNNDGNTWSLPAPVIDTPLDDRDGGIVAFGESSVIVTSFNNTVEMQRNYHREAEWDPYTQAYLDYLEKRAPDWRKYLGSTYRISHDNGVTFGEIKYIPVTCPHGPAVMNDGSLIYVGNKYEEDYSRFMNGENYLAVYKMYADGSYEFLSEIENVGNGHTSFEPHTIVLEDGKIIVHIRVEGNGYFTIYQSESTDGGHTFTSPRKILGDRSGAPAHIIKDGDTLISVYGHRDEPQAIHAMFSRDGGETWDVDNVITDAYGDLGYPASVSLGDGRILTVYYTTRHGMGTVINQVIWKYSE